MRTHPDYDPEAVLATIFDLVHSVADVVARDEARKIWIFPLSGESPVHLSLPADEPDSCDVHTGFAFSATLIARAPGDRGADVAELVEEIAAGRVTEFFDFGDTEGVTRPNGRYFGSSGIRWKSQWTEDESVQRAYVIPPWRHQPSAPASDRE